MFKKSMKIVVILISVCIILIGTVIAAWYLRVLYYEPQKREAMTFCNSLIPQLNNYKKINGVYPEKINPEWYKGMTIPALIRIKDFYLVEDDGSEFLLRFRNPGGGMFSDIWGYHSELHQWLNYDGY